MGGHDYPEARMIDWMPSAVIKMFGELVQPAFGSASVVWLVDIDDVVDFIAVLGFPLVEAPASKDESH
jgi:hypothetical protein